jgi:hypothetical protein
MRGEIRPVRAEVAVIAAGTFAITLGAPSLIGRVPFNLFFKQQLHLPPQDVAAFWSVATLAWYGKPIVGLVCDAYPLFGARRRGYLVAGAALAGLLWLGFAVLAPTYLAFMALMTGLILALAFLSTTLGGMLVETGQRHGATGRLSSLRQGLVGAAALLAGPAGGWLAGRPLGFTAVAGASIVLAFLPVVAFLHREPPRAALPDAAVWTAAARQLRAVARSRVLWGAAGLLFVVNVAPSLVTPLFYYQQDVLKMSPQVIGNLQVPAAAGALLGAAAYAALCRILPLRRSLVLGILLNVTATLLYLGYRSAATAIPINAAAGVLGTLAVLPLYDLAARAAPKGSESLGFAILMSVQTLAAYGLSDVLGSYLYGKVHLSWRQLVLVNAGWSAAVLFYLPLLPRALVAAREGRSA